MGEAEVIDVLLMVVEFDRMFVPPAYGGEVDGIYK